MIKMYELSKPKSGYNVQTPKKENNSKELKKQTTKI
jgi:hypothetical protein